MEHESEGDESRGTRYIAQSTAVLWRSADRPGGGRPARSVSRPGSSLRRASSSWRSFRRSLACSPIARTSHDVALPVLV